MSTDLYGIRVLTKDEQQRRIRLRVFVVYYDTHYENHQPLPRDTSFFFRVISDNGSPAKDELRLIDRFVTLDELLTEAWVDANSCRFIERVEQLSTKNFPLNDYSGYHDFYYERNGKWADEEKLVQADYDVWLTDSQYMAHLAEGHSWGTTSYETNALVFNADYAASLPVITAEPHALKPFSGEQEDATAEAILFSTDGKQLFINSQNNEIVAYSTSDRTELWRAKGTGMFGSLGQDAQHVWLRAFDGAAMAWNKTTGEPTDFLPEPLGRLHSDKGTYILNFGDDENLEIRLQTGETYLRIPQPETVEAAAVSPDERWLAVAGEYEHVEIWDLQEKKHVQTIALRPGERCNSLSFDGTGELLAVIPLGEALSVYDWKKAAEVMRYAVSDDYLSPAAWSPDNSLFAFKFGANYHGYESYVQLYPTGKP